MSKDLQIGTNEIATAVGRVLYQYSVDIQVDVRTVTDVAAEKLKKAIQEKAPVNVKKTKHRGKYKRSWRVKKTRDNFAVYEKVVFSGKEYMLTHLLEKGHKTRNGRTTKAQPHIAPAADQIKKEYVEDITKAVQRSSRQGGGRYNYSTKSYKK